MSSFPEDVFILNGHRLIETGEVAFFEGRVFLQYTCRTCGLSLFEPSQFMTFSCEELRRPLSLYRLWRHAEGHFMSTLRALMKRARSEQRWWPRHKDLCGLAEEHAFNSASASRRSPTS